MHASGKGLFRSCAWRTLLLAIALAAGAPAGAQDVKVVGLFKDRAILLINGQQHILKAGGESSPEGVRLLSADSRQAVLEIDGRQQAYALGAQINASSAEGPVVHIQKERGGHYFYNGKINGQQVRFVVDTGATLVSMNRKAAQKLKLDYLEKGSLSLSETAAGLARIYLVRLDKVSLGPIELLNVGAAVHDNDNFPRTILLGNSFLSRVSTVNDGHSLKIKQR